MCLKKLKYCQELIKVNRFDFIEYTNSAKIGVDDCGGLCWVSMTMLIWHGMTHAQHLYGCLCACGIISSASTARATLSVQRARRRAVGALLQQLGSFRPASPGRWAAGQSRLPGGAEQEPVGTGRRSSHSFLFPSGKSQVTASFFASSDNWKLFNTASVQK